MKFYYYTLAVMLLAQSVGAQSLWRNSATTNRVPWLVSGYTNIVGTLTNPITTAGAISSTGGFTSAGSNYFGTVGSANFVGVTHAGNIISAITNNTSKTTLTYMPLWLSSDRKTLFGGAGTVLYISTDDGTNWTQVATGFGQDGVRGIGAVVEMENGELLVSTAAGGGVSGELWRSYNYPTAGASCTWSNVLTPSGTENYFSDSWGLDAYKNIALACEYGSSTPTNNARYVYLSKDYGVTWATIFDLGTETGTHMHTAVYDPYWDAIWIANGDSASQRALRVSFNYGTNWVIVTQGTTQFTGIVPLRDCILFASDASPNGVHRIRRTVDRSIVAIESAYLFNSSTNISHVGMKPFLAKGVGMPALLPFYATGTAGSGELLATYDGFTFARYWTDSDTYSDKGLQNCFGPTSSGLFVGTLYNDSGYKTLRIQATPLSESKHFSGGTNFVTTATKTIISNGNANSLVVTNGRVGIGTDSPSGPLQVNVSGIVDPAIYVLGDSSMTFKMAHPGAVIGFGLVGGNGHFFGTALAHDAILFGQPGYSLRLGLGGTEYAKIDASGLGVTGDIRASTTITATNALLTLGTATASNFVASAGGFTSAGSNWFGTVNVPTNGGVFSGSMALAYQDPVNSAQFFGGAGGYGAISWTNCVGVGYSALQSSPGSYNNAIGQYALYSSPGSFNNAMGYSALFFSPGSYNSAMGNSALYSLRASKSVTWNSVSNFNNLVWLVVGSGHGLTAGSAIISGTTEAYNGPTYLVASNILTDVVCITNAYISSATTGIIGQGQMPNYNFAIGERSGYYISSGVSNVVIGPNAGPSSATGVSNKLYIANDAGTPLIGGDFAARTVTMSGSLSLPGPIQFSSITASNPPTSGTGTAYIFGATNAAGTAEIFTMDGAGVIKQISEHAMDAPDQLIDDSDEAPNISKEILMYTGKVRWINRSRSARQQEMTTKLALNALAYYQFTTGKTPTQWTNSNSFTQYTNAVAFLEPLTAAQKQIVIVESFAEYNTRNGLTNGNGLVKANWTVNQNKIQSDYATAYTNSVTDWSKALADYQVRLAAYESGSNTNMPAPVAVSTNPPAWSPPPVQAVPSWLQKRITP